MTAIAVFYKNGWDVDNHGNLVTQAGPSTPGYFSAPFGRATLTLVGAPIGAVFNAVFIKVFAYTKRLAFDGTPLPHDGVDTTAYELITEGSPVPMPSPGASGPIYPPPGLVTSQTTPPAVADLWGTPVNFASDAMLRAYAFTANGYGLIAAPPPPAPPVAPIGIETTVAIFIALAFTPGGPVAGYAGQPSGPWVFEVDPQ